MWSEPSSGIKLTAYSCICWLFHRIYYDARNHKHKKQLYIDILCHLRDAVRRKSPDKWRTNSLSLLHDNVPAYWSVVMNDLLAKNIVTTLVHLPHFLDLAAADFYLFPQLKSALMGWNVCDATDIMRNAV